MPSLSLNPTEFHELVTELSDLLLGANLQKVQQLQPTLWFFELRQPGQTMRWLIHTQRSNTFTTLVSQKPNAATSPTSFTMLLRKHLAPSFITQIDTFAHDRRFALHLQSNLDGSPNTTILMVELMHKLGGNLFLLDPTSKLILGQAHQDHTDRALQPGQPYSPLPTPETPPTSQPARWANIPQESHLLQAQHWFESALTAHFATQDRDNLLQDIRRNKKRLRRLCAKVERDLQRAADASQYRQFGELLQSAYGKVKRGASSVDVPNYYDPDQAVVTIPLDAKRSLQQNIDQYFKQYKRLHDAINQIEERLLEAMEQQELLDRATEALTEAKEPDQALLDMWRKKLTQARALRPQQAKRPSKKKIASTPQKPYNLYHTTRGTAVLVGRGSRHNDDLSLKVAKGRDIWLHARDWAGAHVILRQTDAKAPPHSNDLYEAAMLAAHFSKGGNDTIVDVTHTRAKNIRKPKGYPPGRVTVAQGGTLAVSIEPEHLKRLLQKKA